MADLPERKIEYLNVVQLRAPKRNARTHSKRQVRQLADAIAKFGFNSPVVIDDGGVVMAGNGRVAAAKLLGMQQVPCIRMGTMSAEDRMAYAIADNQLALLSGWNKEVLALDFQELLDAGFHVEATGFELADVDQIIFEYTEGSTKTSGPEDHHPLPPEATDAVTRTGDVWEMGSGLLKCGDSKDPQVLHDLMPGEEPDMIITDPPYNRPNVAGRGRANYREFVEAAGEMTRVEFIEFLKASLGPGVSACRDGAIMFVFIDGQHITEVVAACEALGLEFKTICVWAKTNFGMGHFYRSQTEYVTVWKVGKAPHTVNFGSEGQGRTRSTLWTYAGVNTFKAERMDELALHPTVKPTALVADAIRDVSNRGDIVVDMFGGSGTTLIAAQKTGRKARLIEIDPGYCDATVARWEKLTGKKATLRDTGEDFETVSARRAAEKGGWPSVPAIAG